MGIQDFISYVDALPADCIEVKEKDTTQFHLPRNNEIVCPTCGSHYVYIDHYRTQRLRGLPDTAGAYIYNRRRYRCTDCGKTFYEPNPFLCLHQRSIGNRLRQIRAQKKITQKQVMDACGIPLYLYKRYENDFHPEVPPTLVAMQIANYLGADVLEIWGRQRSPLLPGYHAVRTYAMRRDRFYRICLQHCASPMLLGSTICVRFGHIKIRIDRTSMRIGGGKDEKLCDRTDISTTRFVHSVAEIY